MAALLLCLGVKALLFLGAAAGFFDAELAMTGVFAVLGWGCVSAFEGTRKSIKRILSIHPAPRLFFVPPWSPLAPDGIGAPAPLLPPPRA